MTNELAETKRKKSDTSQLEENLSRFFADFAKESDRAAVVVGAAKLDILLRQLLLRVLVPSATSTDDLLDTDRPLGTFSARIHACHRLGLIDAPLARALHLIRRIRNEFAHEIASVQLSSGSYNDRIRDLAAPLRKLKIFKTFDDLDELKEMKGGSKDFRVALALVCARLELAVHNATAITHELETVLVPKYWKEEQ